MSFSLLELRASRAISALAVVSVLHTSTAVRAQGAGTPAPSAAQTPPAASPPAATPHAAAPNAPSPTPAPPSPTPTPPGAPSDETRERARAAYTAGRDAYAAGQYATAETQFGLADSLLPAVQAKFWRAMSLDQLANVPAALAAFEAVLASADKDQLGEAKLASAEERRRALAATPAELQLTTTPAGAHVNVSGVQLTAPTPLVLRLAPGRHVVRVSLEGYVPQQIEIVATPGARLTPSFSLVPVSGPGAGSAAVTSAATIPALAAGPADAPPPAPRSPIPGYVTLGIAGASAIVGTIFGIKALGDKHDYDESPTTKGADDTERNALIADMAFGVTLTLGITGIVLLIADDPAPDQPQVGSLSRERLQISPYVAPTGAGASATLTF
jgi:PEGA domain-containing protein